jgi:hypothetical protein
MSWLTSQVSAMVHNGPFKGFILAIDNFPPFLLGFTFNPEMYKDNFDAEFEWATSPASRYQFPIFKGNSPRTITFTLKYDVLYPIVCELGMESLRNVTAGGVFTMKSLFTDEAPRNLEIVVSLFEKLKLPKSGIASNIFTNAAGNFLKLSPSNDPNPPLALLMLAVNKFALGYVSKAEIEPEKFNHKMLITRMKVNVEFFVVPDLIFTTIEDAVREVNMYLSFVNAFA